jgi:hypothetical protein
VAVDATFGITESRGLVTGDSFDEGVDTFRRSPFATSGLRTSRSVIDCDGDRVAGFIFANPDCAGNVRTSIDGDDESVRSITLFFDKGIGSSGLE